MATERVSGLVLWANLHLLFWLSLIPFTTGWLGENEFAATPAAAYGIVLLAASLAYFGLQAAIIHAQGDTSGLALAIGHDLKGKVSPLLYALGIGLAFVNRWLSVAIYVAVALMWLIPPTAGSSGHSAPPAGHLMPRLSPDLRSATRCRSTSAGRGSGRRPGAKFCSQAGRWAAVTGLVGPSRAGA